MNFATVFGDESDVLAIATFGGGAFVRVTNIPQISIQAELLYTIKGFEYDFYDGDGMKLTYLEIPVLLMYKYQSKGI